MTSKKLNKTEWLVISCFLLVVFGIAANWFIWAEYAMIVPLAYIAIFSLIMIGYGIRNAIRDLFL
jgi:hypothetical protein